MAIDLAQMLIDFLCPTSSAASQCQSFMSSHSAVMPPFGQYIYFLFFPTVFLLLFLWIIFKDAIKANKGISLIATIAVYVFIIIQGLYPIFLALGELWIAVIFLLGFFYLITRHFRKDGGKGGGMPSTGRGMIGDASERLKKEFSGEMRTIETKVDRALEDLEPVIKRLNSDPNAWRAYSAQIAAAHQAMSEYSTALSIGRFRVGGHLKQKTDKLEGMLKKISDFERKTV